MAETRRTAPASAEGTVPREGPLGNPMPTVELQTAAQTPPQTAASSQKQPAERDKLWTPMFAFIICMSLATFIMSQGLNSGITVYINYTGGTSLFAGYLGAVFSVAAGMSRIVSGLFLDRRGRYLFIVGGSGLFLAATIGEIICVEDTVFTVLRFIQGAGFGLVTTSISTAAADVLPLSRLGEGIGYFGLGQAIGFAIGPAFGVLLVSMDPHETLFWGFAGCAMIAFAIGLLVRYEKKPFELPETSAYRQRIEQQDFSESSCSIRSNATTDQLGNARGQSLFFRLFERKALPGAIPHLIMSPLFGFGVYFMAAYGGSLGIENPGVFFTCAAIMMIVLRLKSGAFMDTVPSIKVFAVSAASGLVCCLLLIVNGSFFIGTPYSLPLFGLAGLMYGTCTGLASPVCQTVAVKNTPPERWGAANALFMLFLDIGMTSATIIWGVVNDAFGYQASLWGVALCITASFVAALICFPSSKKCDGKPGLPSRQ